MPAPITENFEEMVLEISTDDGTTWQRICGIVGVTVTRQAQTDSSEVPADCDDESLPLSVTKKLRAIDVSLSGEGVFAAQSAGTLKSWFYGEISAHARVHDANAAVGDIQYEHGPAILTQFTNQRTKGQVVTASIQIDFETTPQRTVRAA